MLIASKKIVSRKEKIPTLLSLAGVLISNHFTTLYVLFYLDVILVRFEILIYQFGIQPVRPLK